MEQVLSSPRGHSDWEQDQNSIGYLLLDTRDPDLHGDNKEDGERKLDFSEDEQGIVPLTLGEIFQENALNLDNLFQTCRYSGVEDVLSWEKGLECAAPEWQHQACNPQELAGEVVPGASGVSPGDVTDSGISSRESEEVCLQNLSPPSLPGFTDATPPSEKSTRGMESGNPPGLIEELPQDAENTPSQTSDLELKNTPSQTSDLELTNTPAQKEAPQTIELVQCTDLEQECLSPDPHTSSLSRELWPHSMNPQPLGTQIPQTHVSDRNWELHQSSPSQMMDLLQSESEELLGLGKALSPLKVSVRTSHSDSEPSAKPSSYSPSSSSLVALTPGDSISLVVSKELPDPLLDGYSISPWTGEDVTLVPIAEGEGSFLEHLSDRLSGSSAAPVTSTEISSGSTRENAPEQTTIPTATDEVIPHGPSLDVDVKSIPDPEVRLETAGDVEPVVSPDSRLDIPSTDIIQTALPALPSEEHSSPDDSPETTHSAPECDVGASLNALEMDLDEDKHLTTGPCLSPHTLYSVPSLVELCEAVRDSACAQSNCVLPADTSLVDLLNSHNPESIPPTEGLAAPVHPLSCPITDTLADASESFGTRREAITLSDDSSPHMHSEAVNKESSPADWEGDKERGTRPQITLAIAPDSDQTSEGSALESGNTVLKHFVLDGCSDSIDLNNSLSERSESVYEKTLPVDSNEEVTSASPAPADNQTEGVCFHSQVTSLSAREPSLSGTSPFTCGASQVTLVGVPETAQTHTPSVELSRESNSNSHPQVDLHQVTHTQVDLHQVPHTQIDLHMVTHIQADLHKVPHTQVDIQREKLAPTVEELQQVEVPQVEVPQADNTAVHLWQVTQRDVSVAQGGEFEEQDASPGGVSSQEELPVAVTMDPGVCTGVPGPVEVALDVCGGPDCELTGTLPLTMVSTETHPDEEQSPLRAVFQALDQDGDGFVRIEEFMEFATAYGADQLKDLTRFLDPSGLGVISFEDFHRGISAINSGGSDPELYKLELSSSDANGAAEEYDEQAEVSDSAYLGSESAYSECETFTDEDSGALVHPELHEDVETDSGIENTLTEHEETRNRFSLGSDLHGHALVAVIGGEEEHFEDFGESNTSDLLLANQEEGRAVPEGTEGEPEPHTHPGSPLHRPQMLLSPSPGDFPASLQTFLQTEALEFFCTHCHKQISRLEDLSTRLHLLEMNSSSKRLSSKKAARHLLQASVLEGMGDLAHDVLDLDSDITDKVLLLERRVCELEQDSVVSEEQHARLRQENLALVHRANALEEQLKEQELLGDESLQTLARKHRDASAKLQRERDLEIENLQARLHQLDEENSELRSCVPCLRANIERLEEEKRKLQDEVEDVTERLNEELDSRRKMADKLSHERHSNQKEKESTQELIEDLRKQLEHLQLFKLETEARRGRSPSAGLQEYNTRTREHELEQEIRRLKQDNRSLKEQNDELNGQIINLSIQGAKNLVSASFSESLAAEINSVSRSELMEAIHKQEEINYRLQDYIDRIIVAIMESNPSILEVK